MFITDEVEFTPLVKGTLASIQARERLGKGAVGRPASTDIHARTCIHVEASGNVCGKVAQRGKGARSGWLCWEHDRAMFPLPVGALAPTGTEKVKVAV